MLRPGGKVGLADLTRNGPLSPALQTLPAWTSCLGDARPVQDYLGSLAEAGPSGAVVEPHDEALRDLVHSVRGKLLGAELLMALGKLTLPAGDLEEGKQLAKAAAAAIARGELGYSLMVATRD